MSKRQKSLAHLKSKVAERKQEGHSAEVKQLLNKVELQQEPAQCDPYAFDCVTLTLPAESIVCLDEDVNISADYYALECCTNETAIDAWTPCGLIENACKVNEIKAVGHINYVASLTATTYYNNGEADCEAWTEQTFSIPGTTCVDNTLCYTALDEESPCPDFCNGNTQAYAFIADVDFCFDKMMVTIGVVFELPECNDNAPEPTDQEE
jgi:hypothetical protein